MARRKQLKGTCAYCAREMTGGGLTRHLKTCKNRQITIEQANKGPEATQLYHLQVKSNGYWLHLEMRGTETLEELDSYLRSIWLECCGHLSQFQIGPYTFSDMPDYGWGNESEPLDVEVSRLFRSKLSFEHEYDFGTSTISKIQVMDERIGVPTTPHPIALMARNHVPEIDCMECGEPADSLCQECMYSGGGALCEEHGKEHECGEEMLIDLVNSPRTGECGYDGPAKPPY